MTSNRLPPELNVDMKLSLDDEDEPIRVKRSEKRRRYAVLEDDDDDDDDDDDQFQAAKVSSYHRHESFQQSQESVDKFVLPEQDESSSSEGEDEDDHVPVPSAAARHFPQASNSQSRHQSQFAGMDDEDYHFARMTQYDKENISEHDMYLGQPSAQHEVVDLCASDDDSVEEDFTSHQDVHFYKGVRTPHKSPRFNANSRDFFSPNRTSRPLQALTKPQILPAATTLEDDIVDCWSSEDEGNRKPRARRVTDAYEPPQQSASTHSSWNQRDAQEVGWTNQKSSSFVDNEMRSETSFRRAASHPPVSGFDNHVDDDDDEQVFVPAPSRTKRRDSLNRFKAERVDRRRRLRDATSSKNTAAAVVIRNAPFQQASDNVWFRQGPAFPPPAAPFRNDLSGGSGVGAGNYTFNAHPPEPADDVSSKGRKKKTAAKRATKTGGRKKKWGGGRKSYYRKKGGGKDKSRGATTNRNTWSNGGRTSRASNEEYSRQDPILKHVGGANIIF